MKKQLLMIVAICCAMGANAQIKVNSNGKVIAGLDRTADDPNNVLTMSLFGKNENNYRPGSKLAFGDFGSYTTGSWHVFVGEFGDTDTDRLWLHGRNGLYITCTGRPVQSISTFDGTANYVVAYFNTSDNAFRFNVPVYTNLGVLVTSDKRFKKNIKGIDNAMASLKKLNGVSFDYKLSDEQQSDTQSINVEKRGDEQNAVSAQNSAGLTASTKSELTEKELVYEEEMKQYDKLRAEAAKNHLGLIAQEVQSVFPELVKEDTAGYLYVDYIGLIPVIIEALKEQQTTIDAQSQKIKELEKTISSNTRIKKMTAPDSNFDEDGTVESIEKEDITTNAFLFQNTPNPFSSQTEIKYFIPENAENVVLYVFSLNGKMLITKPITQLGNGSVTINGNELEAGMYIYTLAIDGQEVDSKRMILNEK